MASPNSPPAAEIAALHQAGALAPRVVVALAAHDSSVAIGPALLALAAQTGPAGLPIAPGGFGVALLVAPGCVRIATMARALAPDLPFPLVVQETALPAGPRDFWSRRRALELAARWHRASGTEDAVMLLTEARARPAPMWLWSMLRALDEEAEAVLGRVALDPDLAESPELRQAARLAELAGLLDPSPDGIPLAGWAMSDSNLGMRLATWRRLGAVPPRAGDAALIGALRRADSVLRPAGAGAELTLPGPELAPAVPESLRSARRRLRLQAGLRRLWTAGVGTLGAETPELHALARALGLVPGELARRLSGRRFGEVLEGLGRDCPALWPEPAHPSRLGLEAAATAALLARLRLGRILAPARGPGSRRERVPVAADAARA